MELGWWNRDEDGKKYQVNVRLFGMQLQWTCQRGRFQSWEKYEFPTEEDWDRAIQQAENRYQRRLMTKDALELVRKRGAP